MYSKQFVSVNLILLLEESNKCFLLTAVLQRSAQSMKVAYLMIASDENMECQSSRCSCLQELGFLS